MPLDPSATRFDIPLAPLPAGQGGISSAAAGVPDAGSFSAIGVTFVGDAANAPLRRLLDWGAVSAAVRERHPAVLDPPDPVPVFWPQLWPTAWWPLVLTGPAGAGKTALAQAILAPLDQLAGQDSRVLFWTAHDLARQVSAAMEDQMVSRLQERVERAAAFCIDDVHRLERYPATQAWLCQQLDRLQSRSIPVVCTAPDHPGRLAGLQPALASRLVGGLTVPVAWPGEEARRVIVGRMMDRHGISCDPSVLDWLARKFPVSVPSLGKVTGLLALSRHRSGNLPVSLSVVSQLVADATSDDSGFSRRLVALIARHAEVRVSDILGTSRQQTTVLARGLVIYLLREVAGWSFSRIGLLLRGKDHSTVLHSHRKIIQRSLDDPAFAPSLSMLVARTAELVVACLPDSVQTTAPSSVMGRGNPVCSLSAHVHGGSAS